MTKHTLNAIKKARQLVAGFMPYDELCRAAAHNLAERRDVQNALNERRLSKPRKAYLEGRMECLKAEKEVLESKHARIAPHVNTSEFSFII